MNFFKSVFSEPSPPSSPTFSPPDPEDPTPSWDFGSTFIQSIASKSGSFIGTYYKDLQDFTSGLKEETLVIRQAATRVVQDLPSRLDSGAAIAQESLEAVGQAIDNVAELIGNELKFVSSEIRGGDSAGSSGDPSENSNLEAIGRPYSRLEALIAALQGDIRTYCDEIDGNGYSEWKLGFRLEDKSGDIEELLKENRAVKKIHSEIVPDEVDDETFWCRYFYRVETAVKAEEARAMIVKRAISGDEDEELTWDLADDIDADDKAEDAAADVSNTKSDSFEDKSGDRLSCSEKEGSDGRLGSDISIISSQRTSHAEEDMGWDEVEYMPSGDESRGDSQSPPQNVKGFRKRMSSLEDDDEEELSSWELEGEDEAAAH